jgi:hypothetical protein
MKYRNLGDTGLSVSEIGYGCEGFVGKSDDEILKLVDVMEENGISNKSYFFKN